MTRTVLRISRRLAEALHARALAEGRVLDDVVADLLLEGLPRVLEANARRGLSASLGRARPLEVDENAPGENPRGALSRSTASRSVRSLPAPGTSERAGCDGAA